MPYLKRYQNYSRDDHPFHRSKFVPLPYQDNPDMITFRRTMVESSSMLRVRTKKLLWRALRNLVTPLSAKPPTR